MTRTTSRCDCGHELHVHVHQDQSILELLEILIERQCEMSQAIDELTSAVTENTSVDESAITLLEDIADRLEAAATDPAAVSALAADLRASSARLADAVVANTPAADPSPVEPPVVEPPVDEPPVVDEFPV